jgi:hypothetical protein
VATVLLFAGSATAQEPGPLVTDRPDQTESALAVAPGYVQLEVGWSYAEADAAAGRVEQHRVPGSLARVGVVGGLEARVGFQGWRHLEVTDTGGVETTEGAGPLVVGAKYQFTAGAGLSPAVALIGELVLPTAAEDFGPPQVDPVLKLALAHDLGEILGLGYNLGVARESQGGGESSTLTQGLYSVALGAALGERAGAFGELFGTVPLSDEAVAAHALHGGLTFLLLRNLQLDATAGVGLNDGADDWFVGVGLSVRVPR